VDEDDEDDDALLPPAAVVAAAAFVVLLWSSYHRAHFLPRQIPRAGPWAADKEGGRINGWTDVLVAFAPFAGQSRLARGGDVSSGGRS